MFCFNLKFLKPIWNFHWYKILLQWYVFLTISPFDLTSWKVGIWEVLLEIQLSYLRTTFRWLTHHYIISLPSIVPLDKDSNNGSNNNTFIYMQQSRGVDPNFFRSPSSRFWTQNNGNTCCTLIMMGTLSRIISEVQFSNHRSSWKSTENFEVESESTKLDSYPVWVFLILQDFYRGNPLGSLWSKTPSLEEVERRVIMKSMCLCIDGVLYDWALALGTKER